MVALQANKNVTRMDIFLSLVQLLQQNSHNRSSDQLAKVISSGVRSFAEHQQSPMLIPVGLAERWQWTQKFGEDHIGEDQLETFRVLTGAWCWLAGVNRSTGVRCSGCALCHEEKFQLLVLIRSYTSSFPFLNFLYKSLCNQFRNVMLVVSCL